ncbi:glyoxalase superfamily protein [Chitinophaga sp. Cy-1792]|uniref:glyoxalase superfamily protein n=1 Tax=Chitinophaga sp. Cy-1792 TaxID=2608339 RepID=UPI00141F891D|nr:glyoxalase superfamily protein [Chitinophaga sp. Cy-1792]NIG57584.1 VOC family protein [Chitinophaga sp. Cy-1792]
MANKVIPVLRMFDVAKATEFYCDWLGFKIDWEHRFEENTPLYMQISLGDIVLHLSEHHGDSAPGAKVLIAYDGLAAYHRELIDKNYKYNKPGLEKDFWAELTVTVHDPFYNQLIFNEPKKEK